MIETTSSGITYQRREIYHPYAGAAGMLLHKIESLQWEN